MCPFWSFFCRSFYRMSSLVTIMNFYTFWIIICVLVHIFLYCTYTMPNILLAEAFEVSATKKPMKPPRTTRTNYSRGFVDGYAAGRSSTLKGTKILTCEKNCEREFKRQQRKSFRNLSYGLGGEEIDNHRSFDDHDLSFYRQVHYQGCIARCQGAKEIKRTERARRKQRAQHTRHKRRYG